MYPVRRPAAAAAAVPASRTATPVPRDSTTLSAQTAARLTRVRRTALSVPIALAKIACAPAAAAMSRRAHTPPPAPSARAIGSLSAMIAVATITASTTLTARASRATRATAPGDSKRSAANRAAAIESPRSQRSAATVANPNTIASTPYS